MLFETGLGLEDVYNTNVEASGLGMLHELGGRMSLFIVSHMSVSSMSPRVEHACQNFCHICESAISGFIMAP